MSYKSINRRSSVMNVGRRVDYALRALSYLAGQPLERLVRKAEIQERQAIPSHYLSKILRMLVSAGFLRSVTGPRGGFRLVRPPADISIRNIYESVERQLSLTECVGRQDAPCDYAGVCPQTAIWEGAQRVLEEYLESVSLSDIADQQGLAARWRDRGAANGAT